MPDICRQIRARSGRRALGLNAATIEYPERPGARFSAEPDADALAWLRAKGYQVGFDYRDVWREEHANAFTVAEAVDHDVLESIRAAVDSALANGDTFGEFSRDLRPILERLGWWGKQEMVDPITGETRLVQLGSPRRLRTIYETNLRTARAAGQWARIQRRKLTHPYLLYALGPSRDHREQHVEWQGMCLPVDDPWWDTYFPPSGWGCLCWVRQITTAEYRRLVRDGLQVPGAPIMDPETGLPTGHIELQTIRVQTSAPPIEYYEWRNKRTGETIQVARGCDPGWDYHPGKHRGGPPTVTPPTPAPAPTPAPKPRRKPAAKAAPAPAPAAETPPAPALDPWAILPTVARALGEDLRSWIDAPPTTADPLAEVAARMRGDLAATVARTGRERAHLLNEESGRGIGAADGGRSRVNLPPSWAGIMADPARRLRLLHSHPGGSSLSLGDFRCTAQSPGLTRIEAITADGTVYSGRANWSGTALGRAHRRAEDAVSDALLAAVGRNAMSGADHNRLWGHCVNAALAQRGVIDYDITPRGDMARLLRDYRDAIETVIAAAYAAL